MKAINYTHLFNKILKHKCVRMGGDASSYVIFQCASDLREIKGDNSRDIFRPDATKIFHVK
jgi:cyanophycinase-like exopeptidase